MRRKVCPRGHLQDGIGGDFKSADDLGLCRADPSMLQTMSPCSSVSMATEPVGVRTCVPAGMQPRRDARPTPAASTAQTNTSA